MGWQEMARGPTREVREAAAARRRMPSLDGLRAFEAAARRLSFTDAADELCVTQGAVSQRIKALEAELGTALFERQARGLVLTPRGRRLADGVRVGLQQISQTLADLTDAPSAPLVVSVLPSLASRWLIPRLSRFTQSWPGEQVQIQAENGLADLRCSELHAALRFGPGRYGDAAVTTFMGDAIVPVASPLLLGRSGPIGCVDQLASLPILYDSPTDWDESGTGWTSWLAAMGRRDVRLPPGQRFSQADLMLDAAVAGLGVALGRVALMGDDLATGRLVRLGLAEMPTRYAYHLVCRPEMARDQRLERLRAWLIAEGERVYPPPSGAPVSQRFA